MVDAGHRTTQQWADVAKEGAVEPQLVIDAAPRQADKPKAELKELTSPKPQKSLWASGGGGRQHPTQRGCRMPRSEGRPPSARDG